MKRKRPSRKLRKKIPDDQQNAPSIDTISGLPDSILCHILSFLPTKSSVATSVLARRWRFLWADVPTLDLEVNRGNRDAVNRFVSLNKVQKITTFRLDYYRGETEEEEERDCFREWVTAAFSRAGVEKIHIEVRCARLPLPASLIAGETLVELRLCFVPVPRGFAACFPGLKSLHLNRFYSDEHDTVDFLPGLLAACPVLEELIFERLVFSPDALSCCVSSPTLKRLTLSSRYDKFYARGSALWVEINATALRYLFLEGRVSDHIVVGELASLIEADISLCIMEEEDDVLHSCSMLEFVGRLCNVRRLKLSCVSQKAIDYVLSAWTVKFHNLTKLELTTDWRFISMFLENADNLEVLIVGQVGAELKCWVEPQKVPTCLLSHLKTVKIDQFECTNDVEFELVRYLLRNAKALNRMEIHTQRAGERRRYIDLQGFSLQRRVTHGVGWKKKFEVLQRISLFERGSETCTLAFD